MPSSTAPDQARIAAADAVPGTSLHEVSDGVFAYVQHDGTWWINNTGFLVGRRGVLAIDTCSTERRTRQFLDTVKGVTHAPVRTLVNTHHHGDHTFGNALVAGATIVAHEATRDAMRVWGPPRDLPYWTPVEWGELELELPFLTFTDRVTSWVDDLQVEIRHVGTAAHTTNDSIVWVPERQVLFAGDLMFAGGTPFLVQGSVAGAIETLENVVRPLGATTIVAGHGPVSGPDLIETTLGYLRFVQHVAGDAVRSGVTPLDAARDLDLGEYANWSDAERIVGNLHRACAEANGAAPGAPIELPAALADMVIYNGGPLATHA